MRRSRPLVRGATLGLAANAAALILRRGAVPTKSSTAAASADALGHMAAQVFRWSAFALAVALGALSWWLTAAEASERRRRQSSERLRPHRARLARVLLGPGCALVLTPLTTAFAAAEGHGARRPPPVLVEIGPAPTSGLDPAIDAVPAGPGSGAALAGPAPTGPEGSLQGGGTHVVQPGEHFWAIAADLVRAELGRPPAEHEIRSHWVSLVAANRDRLVDPANPDLLLPGQRLIVPG